jgi:hypothetical protein
VAIKTPRQNTDVVARLVRRLKDIAFSGSYNDLTDTPTESDFLPRDTYEDEVFVIPVYHQLVLGGTVTLLGSASLDIQGALVVV